MGVKENFKTALSEIFLTKPTVNVGNSVAIESPLAAEYDVVDFDTSVISSCSHIDGNMYSENHIHINGTVFGNVVAKGNILAKGQINGDISCHSICLSNCEVCGNISAVADAKIGPGSVIRGDIAAKNLFSSGAIHGNVFVGAHVHFSDTSCTCGSLRAKTVSMEDGACFSGQFNTKNVLREHSE